MPPLVDRIDSALNPLMIKEAHQSFRNRSLLLMSFFALGVPLLVFMGTIASRAVNSGSDSAGDTFFRTLSGFAVLVTWVAVPARAAAQFHGEVRSRTVDLTALTCLSPWQLASGRFQAAALQILLLLSFLAPFAVASIALGGVGAEYVLPQLVLIFLVAMMQSAAALLTVTAASLAPRLIALFALIGLGELLYVLVVGIALATNMPVTMSWFELAWPAVLFGLSTLFFLRLSADMLTPGGMRSYVRSKLAMIGLLALFFAAPLLAPVLGLAAGGAEIYLAFGSTWLCGFGLLWSGADRRPGSAGRFGFVLQDGPESTVLYVVFLQVLIAVIAQLRGWHAWIPIAFLVYFVFFVGSAALLQSWWFARSAEGFFVGLLLSLVIDLVATFVVLAQAGWSFSGPSPASVLMPTLWATEPQRVLSPVTALPLVLGVVFLVLARHLQLKPKRV